MSKEAEVASTRDYLRITGVVLSNTKKKLVDLTGSLEMLIDVVEALQYNTQGVEQLVAIRRHNISLAKKRHTKGQYRLIPAAKH